MFLTEPKIEYREEFLKFVELYDKPEDETYINLYKNARNNFEKYVLDLNKYAKNIDVPDEWVPWSTFWLTDESKTIYGAIRIRHILKGSYVVRVAGNIGYDISPNHRRKGYGDIILKLGLEKAKELGLNKVLLACNENNIASRKIIERNGGVFECKIYDEIDDMTALRYWIYLK